MNVLGLFKLLPRTNCGLCTARACMAFAVALAKGEADPDECPTLSEEARRELRGGSGQGDWRESLLGELRKEVAALRFEDLAPGLGAGFVAGSLSIRCLGRDFLISPDGTITATGPLSPWVQILLLHYIRTRGDATISGRWVSFTDLKAGLMKSKSFSRDCEEPLRALFDRDPRHAELALERLGGLRQAGTPAPVAWKIFALPRVPVLLLYWPQDEEFPSKIKILFDATADRFLDVESLTFLIEGLVKNIESGPDRAPHD
ncbi:MAG: DUF3786 domain-containing protein [Candidatus Methylomirabilia bacterium]